MIRNDKNIGHGQYIYILDDLLDSMKLMQKIYHHIYFIIDRDKKKTNWMQNIKKKLYFMFISSYMDQINTSLYFNCISSLQLCALILFYIYNCAIF